MTRRDENPLADIRGAARLAIEATTGVARVVEHMHRNIRSPLSLLGTPPEGPMGGITGLVYTSIRSITRLVGGSIDLALAPFVPLLGERLPSADRDAVVAVLNGVVGDHLAATRNPLALPMQLRRGGKRIVSRQPLPDATGKIVLLVHGLCMSDRGWRRHGHDHGEALEAALGGTALYLLYNSGRRIAENGRELADRLERLVGGWPVPVESISIVGHSMGGLVARSACHQAAKDGWIRHLRHLVCLGTPHLGAPLERAGGFVDRALDLTPYTAPLAALGRMRSAGINDLRHGLPDLPVLEGVNLYVVAGATGKGERGDGLVPVASALGRGVLDVPESHRLVVRGAGHMDLLDRREVADKLTEWLADRSPAAESPR